MSALFVAIGVIVFASLFIALVLVSAFAFKGSLWKREGTYYLKATFEFVLAMFCAISVELVDNPALATAYFVLFILCFLVSVCLALRGADIGNKSYNKIR